MDIEDIPKEQIVDLPLGVCEIYYPTEAEMRAFLDGLHYADDIDVASGPPFQRDGVWTVRVRVGDWGNE